MRNTNELPTTGLIRLPTILHHFQISRSGFYKGIQDGIYPAPIRHGRKSFWSAEAIRKLIADISKEQLQEGSSHERV